MKLSLFTAAAPDLEPEPTAQLLAEQGWDGVEWRVTDQRPADQPGFWAGNRATWPLTGLEDSLDEIRRVTDAAGLEISGIGGYVRCTDHEGVERMLSATAKLGAPRVRVTVPGVQPGESYREVFARARDDYAFVADRAGELGVQALVELHHGTITASASAAFRLLDGLDPEAVGVIHDLGNLLFEGQENPRWAFDLLGPYLAHVHVKNGVWRPTGTDEAGVTHWEHGWATLRGGIADVADYVDALKEHGYDGWITCEDFSTELPQTERLADDLAYLRSLL